MPNSTASEENTYTKVYDLFVEAAKQKHHPLMLEVKRPYKSTLVPSNLALDGPHSLHRFVITEPGSLGIKTKRSRGLTIVSAIQPNSLGDLYGFRVKDIFCERCDRFCFTTTGSERPWILHVWRALSSVRRRPIRIGCSVENPFIFTFPADGMIADGMIPMDESGNNIREGNSNETDKSSEGNVGSEIIVVDDEDECASNTR